MTKLQKIAFLHPLIILLSLFISVFSICAYPLYLSYSTYKTIAFDDFKIHIKELSAILANSIDGDLHKKITKPSDIKSEAYEKVMTPLVKFHNANPKILYVYTMIQKGGKVYYILDTMSDFRLNLGREPLESTEIMEEVYVAPENQDNWLEIVNDGRVYVTPDFETDNYGTFLSGHAPIYDSNGEVVAISGIDYSTDSYKNVMNRYEMTFYYLLSFCFVFALIITAILFAIIKKIKKDHERIQSLSTFDYLTGLYNRLTFEALVKEAIKHQKTRKERLFLALIDIDNFKKINEDYGHQVGDTALKETAKRLLEQLRKVDVLARFEGDEFILLINDTSADSASKLTQKIQKAFSHFAITLENQTSIHFTVSIGYTDFKRGCSFQGMLKRATKALDKSKQEGKNRSNFLPVERIF